MKFLALLLGWWVYYPYSYFIRLVLRAKGISVGKGFYIQGVPFLKLRGPSKNILIGENVTINGDIDLRIRENGRIVIEDDVTFDNGCRLVAANDALLTFHARADIGPRCVFNCGVDISIGEDTLMANSCLLQSSAHGVSKSSIIRKQNHTYGKISVGRDCWLGARVTILKAVDVKQGAIIGANAVVTKDIPAYSISAGIPAKIIGERV